MAVPHPYRLLSALLAAGLLVPSLAASSILYENNAPNTNLNLGSSLSGNAQSDVGVPQVGTEPDTAIPGSPLQPFILGDQFGLAAASHLTSVTIYEVDNVSTGGPTNAAPVGDTIANEFSSIQLFLGPDGADLSAAGSLGGASISQYYLNGTQDYECILCATPTYYAIWAITFQVNRTLAAGDYDFAVGGVANGSNTFALLTSDPAGCMGGCVSQTPGNGFFLFQHDGTVSGPPILTYSGTVSGYNGAGPLDADAIIQGTLVPEPATFGFMAVGLVGILFARRRSRA